MSTPIGELRHHCGAIVEAGEPLCLECGQPVIFASGGLEAAARPVGRPEDGDGAVAAPSAATAGSAAAESRPSASGAGDRRCRGCDRPVAAGVDECVFCGERAPAEVLCAAAAADLVAGPSITLPGGLRIPLGPEPLILGRLSPDDRVGEALDRDEVSREHATIWFDGSVVWLEDLGSTNGTWLAGRRIDTRVRLPAGTVVVGLGRGVTVTLRVPLPGPGNALSRPRSGPRGAEPGRSGPTGARGAQA